MDDLEEPEYLSGSEFSERELDDDDVSTESQEEEDENEDPSIVKVHEDVIIEDKKFIAPEDRISRPCPTRFEFSILIAHWAKKIEEGAQALLPTTKKQAHHIAYDDVVYSMRRGIFHNFTEEEKKKRLSLYILRPRGRNRYEKWHITEFILFRSNLISQEESDQSFNMMIKERPDLEDLKVY